DSAVRQQYAQRADGRALPDAQFALAIAGVARRGDGPADDRVLPDVQLAPGFAGVRHRRAPDSDLRIACQPAAPARVVPLLALRAGGSQRRRDCQSGRENAGKAFGTFKIPRALATIT